MDTLEHVVLSNAVVATGLALLASLVGLICRRPALIHSLWLLVLIKLITPPIWQVEIFRLPPSSPPVSFTEAPDRRAQPSKTLEFADFDDGQREDRGEAAVEERFIFHQEADAPPGSYDLKVATHPQVEELWKWSSLKPLLWTVWLTGSLGCVLVTGFRVARFQLLLRWAEPAPDELQDRVQLLADCLGLIRVPAVWLVPGAVSPMIWPIGIRPRLLLPHGLLDRLTPEQRDTLLTHELAHLFRRDHWVRALELIVTALYWWHPVVWWGRQAIREAEEECCDAWVMWVLPASSRAYASALVESLDFLAGARPAMLPPAACGLGQFHTLKRRLTMILTGTKPRALSQLGFLAVLGLGVFLPVLPTWGRADGDDDEKKIEKKDLIKKLTKDALKQVDVDAIKKEVRDALEKDLNVDMDLAGLGDLKIDLNLDLEGLMDNLNVLGDLTKDGADNKDLARARAQIQRAMAQVERAKAQFDRAQAVLKKAQAKLADLEAAAKTNPDKADRMKESKDKVDWKTIEKAKKDKAEKMKDFTSRKKPTEGKSKEDDLEKRLDRLMREVQDLSRDLKQRRRSTDKEDEEGN